ncbi:MAG: hypothetical protein IJS71_03655 [Clostridia bacterium]|nr:hypothetical protein [Clostridia bacterium]
MNDLELLKHAKSYIDKMANGMNPLTNEPVPETDLLNDIKISRCLFYVSGILQGLLNNDQQRSVATRKTSRKSEFSITADELARYEFSQEPLTISELTHRINTLVDLETMKPLHYRAITEWLSSIGLLEEKERPTGGLTKRPTESGEQLGIKVEERVGIDGNIYYVNIYDIQAQEYIIANLPEGIRQ